MDQTIRTIKELLTLYGEQKLLQGQGGSEEARERGRRGALGYREEIYRLLDFLRDLEPRVAAGQAILDPQVAHPEGMTHRDELFWPDPRP